jgi:hypothetical protein
MGPKGFKVSFDVQQSRQKRGGIFFGFLGVSSSEDNCSSYTLFERLGSILSSLAMQ